MHMHNHHDHEHEKMDHPGHFELRELVRSDRDYNKRQFTVGIGGPVGSGKTAIVKALCEKLRNKLSLAVVTNDIFTKEDAEFLTKKPSSRTRTYYSCRNRWLPPCCNSRRYFYEHRSS